MAAADWTGPIGTGIMAVVVDTDNISATHVMREDSVSGVNAAKTQYEHLTAAAFDDGGIAIGIRMRQIINTSTSISTVFMSVRSQGTGENDDRYEMRMSYTYTISTGITVRTISIYRVVGGVDTLIATLSGYTPPAGITLSSPYPIGDNAYNIWKFQAITVGSSVRLRLQAKAVGGSYETVISASDTGASRITATGRTRFGSDVTSNTAHGGAATFINRMDDADVHTLT